MKEQLRQQFDTFKESEDKEAVLDLINEVEDLFYELDEPNVFDEHVMEVIKTAREEKKFYFRDYVEVIRFITEHRRLNSVKPKKDTNYIILG